MIKLKSNRHTLTAYSCFVIRWRHVLTTPCAPVPSNSSVNLYLSLNDMSEYELAARRFFFLCCLFCTLFIGDSSVFDSAFVVSRKTSSLQKKITGSYIINRLPLFLSTWRL